MAVQTLPQRAEVPVEHTWDLSKIYASDELWEADYRRLEAMIPGFAALEGTLGEDGESMLHVFQLQDEAGKLLEQLYYYASMRRDEDSANTESQARADRAASIIARLNSATAFIDPEILELPEQRIDEFMQQVEPLRVYRHVLSELRRQQAHVRSPEIEALLASAREVTRSPEAIYDILSDADLKFPDIKGEDGNDIELTNGRYFRFMESNDRGVRRAAFGAMFDTYGKLRNTTAAAYAGAIRSAIWRSRARNYNSTLEAALDPDAIPVAVYDNLVATVNANLGHYHRYIRLRKRMLGLDEHHMWDAYAPLVGDVKVAYEYERARQLMEESMAPLGDEYVSIMRRGLREERWVDVFENENKRAGAYSSGGYTTQPYILMNYQDSLVSVFTLAHELGHSMHSYWTRHTQPYPYGHYTIFVAEVASTLNEALLVRHLLDTTDDRRLQMYLINHQIETLRTTMFRQTMFAEFEREAHRRMEAGEAMTADSFGALHYELNKRYFGPEAVIDDPIALEWSRIPHFYSHFYVYKYATGIAAATALARQITEEGRPAVERYLRFLGGGSSKISIELLRDAGVDMASPEPVQQACDVFGELVTRMEELV